MKKKKLVVLILLLISMLGSAQTDSIRIFTLGDSNGSFPHSWPKQLQNSIVHADVFNISKPGKTIGFVNNGDSSANSLLTIDANLKKAAEHAGKKTFDYIVIELGTNDAKAVFADRQNEVAVNLDRLLKKIRYCHYATINQARIIVISPPPYGSKAENTAKYKGGDQRVKTYSRQFRKIARKNKCLFVDGCTIPGLDMESMSDDGLHLNAEASIKLIQPVLQLISPK